MPKIPTATIPSRKEVEAALAQLAEFENLTAWRRSARGNLWRKWNDMTVTIFYRGRRYHWSIAAGQDVEVSYSPGSYGDEEEAMSALSEALGLYDV